MGLSPAAVALPDAGEAAGALSLAAAQAGLHHRGPIRRTSEETLAEGCSYHVNIDTCIYPLFTHIYIHLLHIYIYMYMLHTHIYIHRTLTQPFSLQFCMDLINQKRYAMLFYIMGRALGSTVRIG